jgi:hypothetical protein
MFKLFVAQARWAMSSAGERGRSLSSSVEAVYMGAHAAGSLFLQMASHVARDA